MPARIGRLRFVLNAAAALMVVSVGWVWAGNSGAALGLLWWRTPTFMSAWRFQPPRFGGLPVASLSLASSSSWFCPWFVVRYPTAEVIPAQQRTRPAPELICVDELGAAEFARLRREWLARAD